MPVTRVVDLDLFDGEFVVLLDHRKTRQSPHQRLTSLWFGDNYRLKARAFALAQEKVEVWLN